jgi:hypothetical protein
MWRHLPFTVSRWLFIGIAIVNSRATASGDYCYVIEAWLRIPLRGFYSIGSDVRLQIASSTGIHPDSARETGDLDNLNSRPVTWTDLLIPKISFHKVLGPSLVYAKRENLSFTRALALNCVLVTCFDNSSLLSRLITRV